MLFQVLLLLTVTDTPKSAAVLQKFASLYIQLMVFTRVGNEMCRNYVQEYCFPCYGNPDLRSMSSHLQLKPTQ